MIILKVEYTLCPFPLPLACSVLLLRMVVERSPIRSFAADYPIHIFLKHSHINIFHFYAVVYMALRAFQHLKQNEPTC